MFVLLPRVCPRNSFCIMFLSEWLVSGPDANILKASKLYQPGG